MGAAINEKYLTMTDEEILALSPEERADADKARKAVLDELLAEAQAAIRGVPHTPDATGDTAKELLALSEPVTQRGKQFHLVPPTLRVLIPLLDAMERLGGLEMKSGEVLGAYVEIGQRILFVEEDDGLRRATSDELLDSFGLNLPRVVMDFIGKQGVSGEAEGNP